MKREQTPTHTFEEIEAEDRRQVVHQHASSSLSVFFVVVLFVGVMEWSTRPTHRSALVVVGCCYGAIAACCLLLLRRRPQWAVGIAVGGVSAICLAMLSYSPMVSGAGELCVLAINVLLGGFAVAFPLGLRNQLIASAVAVAGYALVLQLGTRTAFPVWYSTSGLVVFLFVVALGARAIERYRRRILEEAFRQQALAAENDRLRQQADEANRAKTDLLSMLSHELRTPLGNMRIFTEILLEGMVTDREESQQHLRRISDQTKRAIDLVQTMLAFGSIETGTLRLTVECIDVAEMMEGVSGEIPTSWRRPEVALQWHLPAGRLSMSSDRGKIEGILRNLVHNALKHTRQGEVTVEAHGDDEATVRFVVRDTGEGIDAGALPQIFDRFSRATNAGPGFGLGLFIVHRFTEMLGGRIVVDSAPNAGSRFEVILPRVLSSPEERAVRAA